MKKIVLGLSFLFLSCAVHAQNGLQGIVVEKYYVSDSADLAAADSDAVHHGNALGQLPIGSVTYRVYANLLMGYTFEAIYGQITPAHNLVIKTNTQFYNNSSGDVVSDWTNNFEKNNVLMLDSWFSVGAAANGQAGLRKTADNG